MGPGCLSAQKSRTVHLEGLWREQENLTGVLAEHLFQVLDQRQVIELTALKWLYDQRPLALNMNEITGFLYSGRTFTRVVLYDRFGRLYYQSSPGHDVRPEQAAVRQMIDRFPKTTSLSVWNRHNTGVKPPGRFPFFSSNKKQ